MKECLCCDSEKKKKPQNSSFRTRDVCYLEITNMCTEKSGKYAKMQITVTSKLGFFGLRCNKVEFYQEKKEVKPGLDHSRSQMAHTLRVPSSPTVSWSDSSLGRLKISFQLNLQTREILCSKILAFHATKYTYYHAQRLWQVCWLVLKGKQFVKFVFVQTELHPFLFLIAVSFWNLGFPSSYEQLTGPITAWHLLFFFLLFITIY